MENGAKPASCGAYLQVGSFPNNPLVKAVREMAHMPLLTIRLLRSDTKIVVDLTPNETHKKPIAISMQIPALSLGRIWIFHKHKIGRLASIQSDIAETTSDYLAC